MTDSNLCSSCEKVPARMGTRCVSCYVKRRAAQTPVPFVEAPKLRSRRWWQDHEYQFVMALGARMRAIEAGLEPGPAEELVDLFYHGNHTPWRQKGHNRRVDQVILKMISDADAYARGEKRGESDRDAGSPQDG